MIALSISVLFGIAVLIISNHYMTRILDWLKFQSIGNRDYIVEKCSQMFIEVTSTQVLFLLVASSVVPFLVIFLIFLPKIIPGLIFGFAAGAVGWKIPKPIVNYMYDKRVERFNMQMVDGLGLMANAMRSGLSVVQALGISSEQMPKPMSEEFGLVLSENKVGVSIEDAFSNLAKRVPCEDVDMFVTAINILKETGGNLAETFDTIVNTIRERLKVENKIKAVTAQGFYQGMMLLCIPPFLGLYFAVTEPGFMQPMFDSPIGWGILGVVILLEVIAYFVIKRVVAIDV